MHKKVLVCLPLNDAHRAALEASVPEFEFRFNALDDVHAEDVLWADVVLGNAPVSMISQNTVSYTHLTLPTTSRV